MSNVIEVLSMVTAVAEHGRPPRERELIVPQTDTTTVRFPPLPSGSITASTRS